MLLIIVACVALSVAFGILFVVQMLPGRSAALSQRLTELEESSRVTADILVRQRRQERSDRFKTILQAWGERLEGRRDQPENRARWRRRSERDIRMSNDKVCDGPIGDIGNRILHEEHGTLTVHFR